MPRSARGATASSCSASPAHWRRSAVEAATRFVFRNVTIGADNSSFFSRRWASADVQINEHGFRERSFSLQKRAGTYRMAVIGDSFTFGNGLPAERALFGPDGRSGCRTGSRGAELRRSPGNNTPHHLETLRSRVLPRIPDFVLLQWFVNDIEGDDLAGRPRHGTLAPHPAVHRWLQPALRALYDGEHALGEVQMALGMVAVVRRYLKAPRRRSRTAPMRGGTPDTLEEDHRHGPQPGPASASSCFPIPAPELGRELPVCVPARARLERLPRDEGVPALTCDKDFAAMSTIAGHSG